MAQKKTTATAKAPAKSTKQQAAGKAKAQPKKGK
jgi:hypothetical protein